MWRGVMCIMLFAVMGTAPALAQVQTIGDVSFAVPNGYTYMAGSNYGSMVLKGEKTFWLMGVYAPMPSSGDAITDLKAAWQSIVLANPDYQGWPPLPYFDITHTVGYPGKRADGSSVKRNSYTRLYVLETGKRFVPVVAASTDGLVLNTQEYAANALIGSIRLAPLKASPIKVNITVADLAGDWKSGMANSTSYYNSSTGQFVGSTQTFYGAGYHVSPNGSFTYKMSGMANSSITRDDDSGMVELGGEFVTFKGRNHVARYRFLNIQTALNGSTVLTLLPPGDMAQISIIRDSQYFTRTPQQK